MVRWRNFGARLSLRTQKGTGAEEDDYSLGTFNRGDAIACGDIAADDQGKLRRRL
jgi:hypothetical protein